MPRNACTTCRSRKIKCITPISGTGCERCKERNIQCSYVFSPGVASYTPGSLSTHPLSNSSLNPTKTGTNSPKRQYRQSQPEARHDIGSGSAAEILREGEFAQELLILYFSNFSDIHFMFDKGPFMRLYLLGEVPKIILYAMMALSIRYTDQPSPQDKKASHKGEILFREARNLLKNDFDHASLSTIQAYVLLSTYHLTFGGARKAWIYLGTASSMCKALRLPDDSFEHHPYQRELIRRLVSTIVLMDCTLSPSLNMICYFTLAETKLEPCDDDELAIIRERLYSLPQDLSSPGLLREIVRQGKVFRQVCECHRQGSSLGQLQHFETQQVNWDTCLDKTLAYNASNFEQHRLKNTLREFTYLHLLTNHIGQLIYFPYLHTRNDAIHYSTERSQKILTCYHHANKITAIIQYTRANAGFDTHNASIGQVLAVTTAVLMHVCLTGSREEAQASQRNLMTVRECLERMRERCRIFDRVAMQLDSFLEICKRSSSNKTVFDRNKRLIRHILHYGTAYERVNLKDAGQLNMSESSSRSVTPPSLYTNGDPVQPNMPQSVDQIDWFASGEFSSEDAFNNCAWMFTDESLVDLYSMSYEEPALMSL